MTVGWSAALRWRTKIEKIAKIAKIAKSKILSYN